MTEAATAAPGTGPDLSEPARLAVVAVVSLALGLTLAIASGSLSVVSLLTPGGLGPSAEVIAEDFGADTVRDDLTGYDGQQVYAIAREFPDLDAASEHLDAPAYRLLRILAPALAAPAPAGDATVVALLGLNVLGFGMAVYGGGRLLQHVGGRVVVALPAAGVLLLGVATTTDGPVTWGLGVTAMALAVEGRHRVAVAILVVAALSRETVSVAAACIGAGCWLGGLPLRRAVAYVLPAVTAGGWYLVLSQMVEPGLPARFHLFGFLELDGGAALVALGTLLVGVYGVYRWRDLPAVALSALAYTGWMAVYTPAILDPLALLRVNALPILLGVLALGRHGLRSPAVEPSPS